MRTKVRTIEPMRTKVRTIEPLQIAALWMRTKVRTIEPLQIAGGAKRRELGGHNINAVQLNH